VVNVVASDEFKKAFSKIKHDELKKQILSQVQKIGRNPDVGKPMRYSRRGTREVYVKPFRLAYIFERDTIYLLDIYHKDEQ
jgi:mRNA-degrading endonuclease RelE of RelBE toxin-antitoxin system